MLQTQTMAFADLKVGERVEQLSDIFDLSTRQMRTAFETFAAVYEAEFTDESVIRMNLMVRHVAQGGDLSDVDLAKFTSMRLAAQRLRSAFMYFDVTHTPPESLHLLVKHMGEVKDAIKANKKKKKKAKKLMGVLENIDSFVFKDKFVMAKKGDLRLFFESEVKESRDLLHSGLRPGGLIVLSAHDYHRVRKALRNLLWYIDFLRDEFNVKGIKKLRKAIKPVSDLMGDIHDEVEVAHIQKVTKKKDTVLDVMPGTLQLVEVLTRMFDGGVIKCQLALLKSPEPAEKTAAIN